MSTAKKPQWVRLPAVDYFRPSQSDKDAWAAQYMRTLARLAEDGVSDPEERMREEIEYGNRDKHPWVKRFHLEALQLAIERHARPPVGWHDVDRWTREDFIARVKQDQHERNSGSKVRIAKRTHMSPTALWRRWELVRHDREPWPSGNKGPADRR